MPLCPRVVPARIVPAKRSTALVIDLANSVLTAAVVSIVITECDLFVTFYFSDDGEQGNGL